MIMRYIGGVGSGTGKEVKAWTHMERARIDYSGSGSGSQGPIITDDAWHHVVFASAAGAVTSQTKIYVDGTLVTGIWGDNTPIDTTSSSDVFIGTRDGGGRHYDGLLDDVRIYDHELSALDVSALAAMGGAPVPEPASVFASLGLLTAASLGFREWRARRKVKVV